LADLLDLLMSNPQIQQFLLSLTMSMSKEAGEKVGKWIVGSIANGLKTIKLLSKEKMSEADKVLEGLISKKTTGITMLTNYYMDFMSFMFPDREIDIEKLSKEECEYVGQRIFIGLSFEQLLLDIGYKLNKMRYLTRFPGLQSNSLYYFDLAASFEQEYLDNLLFARVVNTRFGSPQEFVNSLPRVVSDINGDFSRPTLLRDHDIIAVIVSDELSGSRLTKLRQTIRTVQDTNAILPRVVLVTSQEIFELLNCGDAKERSERIRRKFQEVRFYRGVVE